MDFMMEMLMEKQQKQELKKIASCNRKTERFGLSLTEEDAAQLMIYRKQVLRESRRVEFGDGILPELIDAFCDSDFIDQHNYVDTLNRLQEIFYHYKNESMDELTDSELIGFMRKQFDGICFGDLEYLGGTCLERFARAVRSGSNEGIRQKPRDEYSLRETENEYGNLSEETGWEFDLYCQKLTDND